MSTSKLSTKSASKNFQTQKSTQRRDFIISGEFITGRSNLSLDLDSSVSDKNSFSSKELGNKELKLIENLEQLDASLIPDESNSVSIIREFHYEERKLEENKDEVVHARPLLLENSQLKGKWWCYNCIQVGDKSKATCVIV